MSGELEYIVLNNWLPEVDEDGNVILYTNEEALEILKEGNFIQVAKITNKYEMERDD